MGIRLVALALATALTTATGLARADDPPAPQPWVTTLRHPGAAWVLQVPLKLSLQTPLPPAVVLLSTAALRRPFAIEDYPDPRRTPLQTFRLELHGDQDFSLLGVPMTSRFVGYEPAIAPQVPPSVIEPLWAGDAAVRLPHHVYAGASVWQRVDGQKAVFLVTGQRF